ncbi:MAG: hypothetical protein QF561_01810 [Phycisphaerales bacterium]|jgi:hypothetical protein|nr:hypothetical protein [Phycisphaerales bacterium]
MNRFLLNLRRFGVRLTADRRRFAVLCVLSAVALLFWTRLIVVKRIPRTALAEPEAHADLGEALASTDTPGEPVEVVLPGQPRRDPFAIDVNIFPSLLAAAAPAGGVVPTDPKHAADPKAALSGLRLEASMPPAIAVIDGSTRRRGDTVVGSEGLAFTVLEIHPRSVVLDRSGARYVLRME